MDETLTREERIKIYAFQWYEYYKANGYPSDPIRDFYRGEHIVEAQDRVAVIEADYTFRRKPSRMR